MRRMPCTASQSPQLCTLKTCQHFLFSLPFSVVLVHCNPSRNGMVGDLLWEDCGKGSKGKEEEGRLSSLDWVKLVYLPDLRA